MCLIHDPCDCCELDQGSEGGPAGLCLLPLPGLSPPSPPSPYRTHCTPGPRWRRLGDVAWPTEVPGGMQTLWTVALLPQTPARTTGSNTHSQTYCLSRTSHVPLKNLNRETRRSWVLAVCLHCQDPVPSTRAFGQDGNILSPCHPIRAATGHAWLLSA